MDEAGSDARLLEIASRFSELEYIEAVVLAGSAAGGTSDSQSDQCDPIGDRNSSCALGMKRVCGQLLAESG
jgi:hypothetical protein